ncbi:MAG TPA: SdrD B-like domain-containing protein [Pyrinomonadaceae bacterium]|nr:SdrD B-like domain-containing protein [Pyrinomonadaceae bacterium]
MLPLRLLKLAALLLIPFLFLGSAARTSASNFPDGEATPASTVISNRASASYADEEGQRFDVISETVSLTVLAVSAIVVTPDETESSAAVSPNERVTRIFRICNPGNTPDQYTVTRAAVSAPSEILSLHYDLDGDNALSDTDAPITVESNLSPRLPSRACIGVVVEVQTHNVTPGSQLVLNITSRSNLHMSANQAATDEGTIINAVGQGARLTHPSDAQLQPLKLVDNHERMVAHAGQPLNYTINFRNNGDVPAQNVTVVDELPSALNYVPGSMRFGDRQLSDADDADEGRVSGRRLEVRLRQPLAPGEAVKISFQAMVAGGVMGGAGVVNTAVVQAANVPAVSTSETVVVIDPFGTVYAARGGAGAPVAGARVAMLTDNTTGALLELVPERGFVPNEPNANPYTSNGEGRFSFALTPQQLGTLQQPSNYFINVTASGYRSRLLGISLRPAQSGLFAMTVRSLDGLPLAVAGGFELTTENVEISDIANIALNIPLFENSTMEISKTVDRAQAEIGDALTYRVEVHNATAAVIQDAVVRDVLPASFQYAVGTATLQKGSGQSAPIAPVIEGDALTFQLGQLQPGERANLSYRVRVGVNAGEGDKTNTAIASGRFASGETLTTAPAKATVRVGRGVFSTRQIIMGRVFEDANNNGQFDKDEKPVAGARIYLANGQSVVTDSQGMYNFPAVAEGALVISLDPVTLPPGFKLQDDGTRSGQSWTRLLRTPLGGGALLRQNFALRAVDRKDELSKAPSTKSDAPTAQASLPAPSTSPVPTTPGTFEVESNETIPPVAPGEVVILSPVKDEVIVTPALSVEARVKETWAVMLEVNGERVSDSSIGTTRVDHKNSVTTYGYVGINLRPGPNKVKVTPVGPNKERGETVELIVYGRGPAKRLEIVPEKKELQASGRDSMQVRIRALDEWGHPAADSQVAIETSAGRLAPTEDGSTPALALTGANVTAANNAVSEQVNTNSQQQVISLVGGEAVVQLIADNTAGETKLQATLGNVKAEGRVRFTPEVRDPIMVSLAEVSFGKAAPEMTARGTSENVRAHINLFYRGRFFGNNLLTFAYDSQQALNRANGTDRLFQLDPLARAYPLFGDSSTRFEDAASNSKLYMRVDRGRSYMMFGDMEADMEQAGFASYSRKLTGVKFHVENAGGDFVTVTGARPDTSFARDLFPGGTLSLVQLSHTDILPGSETVIVEVRDRRNPEIILSRDALVRSIDYNLDANLGSILFLRPISAFDYQLNLVQIVVTYEHRANGLESSVYTGRAQKRFDSIGLRLGLSFINQRQAGSAPFMIGGIDGEWQTPGSGRLQFEWATSRGEMAVGGAFGLGDGDSEHNGNAFRASLEQPLPFYEARLLAEYQRTSPGFFNPFGASATPGNTRASVKMEMKPRRNGVLTLGFSEESNRTENVDNSRTTASIGWTQIVSDRLRFTFSYDYRRFRDEAGERDVNSQLVTAGAEWRPTDKLELSVKREQNLGEADPSYPTQTTFSASYQVKPWAKLFLTQRIASEPITPISDTTLTGFAASNARRETAIGIQSKLGRYTTLGGRYQLENGINGTDSFAVIGLQNRLPITKELSVELGYERGFLIAGNGESFNSVTLGASWLPTDSFRSSVRYELRDRAGLGQLLAVGAAGRLGDGFTTLARVQFSRSLFANRENELMDGTVAVAYRPTESDRYGLLFSYRHRSLTQEGLEGAAPTRQRADVLSTDGYYQLMKNLELYGRFALKVSADGDAQLIYVSTMTYMAQGRAQYRLGRYFDLAAETRYMIQPASMTRSNSTGAEIGFWATPDLRLGGGYNFSSSFNGPGNQSFNNARRGFYFTISSKLSNLFDLFGTSNNGLQAPADSKPLDGDGGERQ